MQSDWTLLLRPTCRWIGGLLCLLTFACGGNIIVDEASLDADSCSQIECPANHRCIEGVCTQVCQGEACFPCNSLHPEGGCDIGQVCADGVCYRSGVSPQGCAAYVEGWCPAEQICQGNGCADVPAESACSLENPWGQCPDTQRCIRGLCFADVGDIDCSREHADGFCPSGLFCVDGRCRTDFGTCGPTILDGTCPPWSICADGDCVGPVAPDSCSMERPHGRCPADELCVAGTCTPFAAHNVCSALHPMGLCPAGAACDAGRCVALDDRNACSATHTSGLCPGGAVCSDAGTCRHAQCGDEGFACPPGYWCGDGASCLPLPCDPVHPSGVCLDSMQSCERGSCVDPRCSPAIPEGSCAQGLSCVDGQCLPPACSLAHPAGYCAPGDLCVSGTCIEGPCTTENVDGSCTGRFQSCKPALGCAHFAEQTCCDESASAAIGCDVGNCAAPLCSLAEPDGACPDGEYCRSGVCEIAPCDPFYPTGNCSTLGEVCYFGRCRKAGCLGATDRDAYCAPLICNAARDVCVQPACSVAALDGACDRGQICCNADHQVNLACSLGNCFVPMCSSDFPGGSCPSDHLCAGGACVEPPCSSSAPNGTCGTNYICEDGACTRAACSVAAPWGVCPSGKRCEGGACLPYVCSSAFPSGPCPLGSTCQNESCITPDCAPSYPGGACPSGQICATGSCAALPCSATAPTGACGTGFTCSNGSCTPSPCSVTSPTGPCAGSQVCLDGVCVDYVCGNEFPQGPCAIPGKLCTPPTIPGDASTCQSPSCSATFIGGSCPSPQVCAGGQCITPACSLAVTDGVCPGSLTCCDPGLAAARTCTLGTCVTPDCSVLADAGYCPPGDICAGYICIPNLCDPSLLTGPCTVPGEVCESGVCVEPTCSPQYPGGHCTSPQVCVAGTCLTPGCSAAVPGGTCPTDQTCCDTAVASTRTCSIGTCVVDACAQTIGGWCPAGEACVSGACAPYECGLDFPGAACPMPGQLCLSPPVTPSCQDPTCSSVYTGGICTVANEVCAGGSCVHPGCSPAVLNGACPANQTCCDAGLEATRPCTLGTCVLLDCDVGHTGGRCPGGEVCCDASLQSAGVCPSVGQCAATVCSAAFPFGACSGAQNCVAGTCADACTPAFREGWCPSYSACVDGACSLACGSGTTSDSDCDGISDIDEGSALAVAPDTDGDGSPDYTDRDADGDLLPDAIEAGDLDVTTPAVDSDGDGTGDWREIDADGDHMSDTYEAGGSPNHPRDSDRDGTPDYRDSDSDEDGLPDACEVTDAQGLCGALGIVDIALGIGDIADTDADGVPDFLDEDSDDDGVADCIEALASAATVDGDNSGVADCLEGGPGGQDGKVDHDADGIPDYRDTDSDGDGVIDADEDLNGDGFVNCQVDGAGQPVDDFRTLPMCDGFISHAGAPFAPGWPYDYNPGCSAASAQKCILGESSRVHPDSDGDGIGDGSDGIYLVCSADNLKPINLFYSQDADYALALEQEFSVTRKLTRAGLDAGLVFDDAVATSGAAAVSGFVVQRTPDLGAIAVDDTDAAVALLEKAIMQESIDRIALSGATDVDSLTLVINRNFTSFDGYGVAVSRYRITTPTAVSTALLRDQLAESLDATVAGYAMTENGPLSDDFTLLTETLYRYDDGANQGSVLVVGALVPTGIDANDAQTFNYRAGCGTTPPCEIGCVDVAGQCETDPLYQLPLFYADNITNGSAITQYGDDLAALCQSLVQQHGELDFLWVVDDSGSMGEEIRQVQLSAQLFFSQLNNTEADYRVAQTTTFESRSSWPPAYDFDRPGSDETNRSNGMLQGGFTGAVAGRNVDCAALLSSGTCNAMRGCLWDGSACVGDRTISYTCADGCANGETDCCTDCTGPAVSVNNAACYFASRLPTAADRGQEFGLLMGQWAIYRSGAQSLCTGGSQLSCELQLGCVWDGAQCLQGYCADNAPTAEECTAGFGGSARPVASCDVISDSATCGAHDFESDGLLDCEWYAGDGGQCISLSCRVFGDEANATEDKLGCVVSPACSWISPADVNNNYCDDGPYGPSLCQRRAPHGQGPCESDSECHWYNDPNGIGKCISTVCRSYGDDSAGGARSGSCTGQGDCAWVRSPGSANNYCDDTAEVPAPTPVLWPAGCEWDFQDGVCEPSIGYTCGSHDDASSCAEQGPRCGWDSAISICRPDGVEGQVLCSAGDQTSCEAQGGGWCTWDGRGFCRPPVDYAFRDSATRVAVVLSDEESCYLKDRLLGGNCLFGMSNARLYDDPVRSGRVQASQEFYQSRGFQVFGIVGDKADTTLSPNSGNGGCGSINGDAQAGNAYIEVAEATGGGWGSICALDLSPTIEAIITGSLGRSSPYRLEGFIDGNAVQPISSTIKVSVETCVLPSEYPFCGSGTHMQVVPRSREAGFDYDAVNNTLVLYGSARPALEGDIAVSYRHWIDLAQPPEGNPDCPCPLTNLGAGCACPAGHACGTQSGTDLCAAEIANVTCNATPGCIWNGADGGGCFTHGICEPQRDCGGTCAPDTVCDPDRGLCVCDSTCAGSCGAGQSCDDNTSVNDCEGHDEISCPSFSGCAWASDIEACFSVTCGACLCDTSCGGGCPAGQACDSASTSPTCGSCACDTSCGSTACAQYDGAEASCETAGCFFDATNDSCVGCAPGLACNDGSSCTGLAEVACGADSSCAWSASSGSCYSPTCGFCQPPECGSCPAGFGCDAATGGCTCDTTCGGSCPDGQVCQGAVAELSCGQCLCETDCGAARTGEACPTGTACDPDAASGTCGLCVSNLDCSAGCNFDCASLDTTGCSDESACRWAPWLHGGAGGCHPRTCQVCDASGLCLTDTTCCGACGSGQGGNASDTCNINTGSCECDTSCGGPCPAGTQCDSDPANVATCGSCVCEPDCGESRTGQGCPAGTACDGDMGSGTCGLCIADLTCGGACNAPCETLTTVGSCESLPECRWGPWLDAGEGACTPVTCSSCDPSAGLCTVDSTCCGTCSPSEICDTTTGSCQCDATCGGSCPAGTLCDSDTSSASCGQCLCEDDCGEARTGTACPTGAICDANSLSNTCGLCIADTACGVDGNCNPACDAADASTCNALMQCRWAPWLNDGMGACTPLSCSNCNPSIGLCAADSACCDSCGPTESCNEVTGRCECDTQCGLACGPGLVCDGDIESPTCGDCLCDTDCGGGCPTGQLCDNNDSCTGLAQLSCSRRSSCAWDVQSAQCWSITCGICVVDDTCGGCAQGEDCNPSTGLCEPVCPTCLVGQQCDPLTGQCVCSQNCGAPCSAGSFCDTDIDSPSCGSCVCDTTCGGSCPGGQICDDGAACAGLDTSADAACANASGCSINEAAGACFSPTCGVCVVDSTCGGDCPVDFSCDPLTGFCVPNQDCLCPPQFICNALTLECEPDEG